MNVLPNVYAEANDLQRRDSKFFYETYSHLIQWQPDGNDTVLEIGSGPGDVTTDCLLPILPKDFKHLTGSDIDQNMVDRANKLYSNSKIFFVKWSMVGDPQDILRKNPEGFDHVFSTFSLHWEADQQRILRNIHKLLKTSGDCLLTSVARHNVYDMYHELSKMPKWRPYVKSNVQVTPFYQNKDNCVNLCHEYLHAAGFKENIVELVHKKFIFNSLQETRKFIESISPFVRALSAEQKDDLFVDSVDIILKLGFGEKTKNGKDIRYTADYELLVIYAKK